MDMKKLFEQEKWSLHCNLCGKDVFADPLDYFMLKDEIWNEVTANDYISHTHILCRHCTEKILGREITAEDLNLNAPCNYTIVDEKEVLKVRKKGD